MNKRTGLVLIFLTSFSIIGLMLSQIYWIVNAYDLKRDQFEKRVQMSLKSVSNSLFEMQMKQENNTIFTSHAFECPPLEVFEHINYTIIDSLITNELSNFNVDNSYEYGVYRGDSKKLIGGNFKLHEQEILASEFKVSLGCLRNGSPYFLALYISSSDDIIFHNMIGGFILVGLFVLIIGFSFVYTIVITYKQKKIGIMKTDFVNNMTHEFKTPIATVSLASEMLLRPEIQVNFDKIKKYAQIIYDENSRLKNQVESILNIAALDKGKFKIRKKEMDVHHLLDEIIHNSELFVHEHNGTIKKVYSAARFKIRADKMHFINIIGNLIDNANKYSPQNPEIIVRTKNIKKGILISIEDNGVGIKAEDQDSIFKQFHRVHTGNIHDVKGFGLGLFYAQKMVKEHGGFIRLISTFGIGSTFEIYLPFNDIRNK